MNETEELLSQLRDVQVPPVSAIPALGWWLLGLVLMSLCLLAWLFYRHFRKMGWQRQARYELGLIRSQVGKIPVSQSLAELSKLARRVALVARPRQEIASLHGKAWLNQLDEICGRAVFNDSFGNLLQSGPYQKNPSVREEDLHTLIDHVDELVSAAAKSVPTGSAVQLHSDQSA